MLKIISVTNNKGGVGKTTTARRLATYLADVKKKKICLIDADPQSSLSIQFNCNVSNIKCGFYDLLVNQNIKFEDCIHKTDNELIDIIPTTIKLQEASFILQSNASVIPQLCLKGKISNAVIDYDYLIIDTPPNLDIFLYNCLAVSTDLIIPVKADLYSLLGLDMLLRVIDDFSKIINHKPKKFLFLNCYKESKTHKDFYELMGENFPNDFMNTFIKDRVAISRSLLNAIDLEDDEKVDSKEVIQQFNDLFDEVIKNG